MGKWTLLSALALALVFGTSPAFAHPQTPASPTAAVAVTRAAAESPNRIIGYTAWDDDYFYVALQINKPSLNGKNSEPYSHPLEDDAAIVSIQTDNDRQTTKRTAHTFFVAVSALGGAQFYSGPDATPLFANYQEIAARLDDIAKNEKDPVAQQTRRQALFARLVKYAATPKGAPRLGGSNVPGYTVEVAIPWADLGGRPEAGARMGFNAVAQSTVPGSPPIQSFSPKVRGESDVNNPSLWSEILFSNAPGAPIDGALVCPRVIANKPVIDGDLETGEWNTLSAFEFGERILRGGGGSPLANTLAARVRPAFTPQPPRPVVALVARSVVNAPTPHRPQAVTPLIMARYLYSYQADTRRAAPPEGILRPDGVVGLIHHPLDGIGPWFSYDSADWHRRQLLDIRRAGIDVILPSYRGDPRDRQLSADKGLTMLAAALNSLRLAKQDYPQVAMSLDTSALIETLGDRPDMRAPAAQAAFYGMIRDFYRHIPAPFRYLLPLTAENGARAACVVSLSDASAFQNFDSGFITYARTHFQADFDGCDLVFVGAAGFNPRAGLDGYFSEGQDRSGQFDGDGWIKIATVSPGYDSTLLASADTKPVVRSRRDGQTYRNDWNAALSKKPDWVLLDSWDDYNSGTELAATLETGYAYVDATRLYARLFAGNARHALKFVWNNAPAIMLAKSTVAVSVRAQNIGVETWGLTSAQGAAPVSFSYRWKRGAQVVGEGEAIPLAAPVLPGQDVTLTLPIAASPPEGDYTLEIGPVETGKRGGAFESWFDGPYGLLQIPVKVSAHGPPAWAATLVDTDLSPTMETGGVYDVNATLRNDGVQTWRKADGARVTLRLYREAPGEGGALNETPIASADATAELSQDVAPGQSVGVHLLLPLTTPAGDPLPAWSQDDSWTYAARWEVAPGASGMVRPASLATEADTGTAPGVSVAPLPLAVMPFDFGPRFLGDGTPSSLPAERRVPVSLSLQNVGPQTWKKGATRVGYHWYYLDGTEFLWDDETTPLTQDVAPGGKVSDMLAFITAPPCDGAYYLMWDVKVGDTWASTSGCARIFDNTVHTVEVVHGRLSFADLTKAYTINGITDDDDTRSADLDGQGRTFPSLFFPPFANATVTPSGMWPPATKTGPDSPRRISFRWGPKGPKEKNFISCMGQKVLLGKSGDQARILHFVAASVGKDAPATLKLIFQEPTSQSEDIYAFTASAWDRPPAHNEEIAFLARRHHDHSGPQAGVLRLYHYAIPISQPRKLIAIQLPNAPDIKIAAITLEK